MCRLNYFSNCFFKEFIKKLENIAVKRKSIYTKF